MNTYIQDVKVPIYIILTYERNTMKFPINPPDWTVERDSESKSAEIEGIGEVGIPKAPGLKRVTISSFFWHEVNLLPSSLYVLWLNKWQESKKPARLVVTGLNRTMECTCESFKHWVNAGEENDIYFELQVKEYKPYGAKRLGEVKNLNLLQKVKRLVNSVVDNVPLVLFEIPRPQRSTVHKLLVKDPYKVKAKETLITITKKIRGSTSEWKKLYNKNKDKLGNIMDGDGTIEPGTLLKLPDGWAGLSKNRNDIEEG